MSGVNLSSQSVSHEYDQSSKTDYQDKWSDSAFLPGRKVDAWMDGEGELFVWDTEDLDIEEDYQVKYREGRFGGQVLPYGEFDELEEAFEYAELILQGETEIDELL